MMEAGTAPHFAGPRTFVVGVDLDDTEKRDCESGWPGFANIAGNTYVTGGNCQPVVHVVKHILQLPNQEIPNKNI